MKIYIEIYDAKESALDQILRKNTWAGAKDRIDAMSREEPDQLEEYLCEILDEQEISLTELNDFIWFEWDDIKEEL